MSLMSSAQLFVVGHHAELAGKPFEANVDIGDLILLDAIEGADIIAQAGMGMALVETFTLFGERTIDASE